MWNIKFQWGAWVLYDFIWYGILKINFQRQRWEIVNLNQKNVNKIFIPYNYFSWISCIAHHKK